MKVRIEEVTWGLGLTRAEIIDISPNEEEFFKDIISRCSEKQKIEERNGSYPPIVREYNLRILDS